MKLSLNWLKDFIDIKITPEQLAEKLTMSGTAVEGIYYPGEKLRKIIVGEILKIKPHPNADKLQIVKVSIGADINAKSKVKSQKSKIQIKNQKFQVPNSKFQIPSSKLIVCGATNIKVGDKVPVALPGVILPNGLKIEKREIRGVKSEGMLCAEDELGLGDDHTGILILPAEAKIGESIIKILNLDDVVLDLELTPNRGDCMSVLGIARELSALLKSKIKNQKSKIQFKIQNFLSENNTQSPKDSFTQKVPKVVVEDKKLCPKYCAQIIKNVKVGESPQWLKMRLIACGMRPINNIVDITNYVMLELGQPLHAFEKEKLEIQKLRNLSALPCRQAGNRQDWEIMVRRAKKGEKIITLDNQKRELDESMLVITDSEKPIALAGVMGGAETEVSENTKDIILEAAIFDPISIRKTARKLGLISEASMRFERQVDWQVTEIALQRAADLIVKNASGQIIQPAVIVKNFNPQPRQFSVKLNYLEQLLGIKLHLKKVRCILENLGFKIKIKNFKDVKKFSTTKQRNNETIQIFVPSWRHDITIPADIAEEIGRILDFNTFKLTNISGEIKPPTKNNLFYWENKIKDILVSLGFCEVVNYSFVGEDTCEYLCKSYTDAQCELNANNNAHISIRGNRSLEIIKPLSPEQKYLRQSLIPQLLKTASRNLRFFDNVKIFESARVFLSAIQQKLPIEKYQLAGAISYKNQSNYQLYKKLKGEIEILLNQLHINSPLSYTKKEQQIFLKLKNDINLGQIYLVNQEIKEKYKIRQNILAFNLDLDVLIKFASEQKKYTAISLYPAIKRDISFILPNKNYYQDIIHKVKFQDSLISHIALIDEYYPVQSQRSLTLRITYLSVEKTLTSAEVEKIEQKICSVLEKEFKAKIRK